MKTCTAYRGAAKMADLYDNLAKQGISSGKCFCGEDLTRVSQHDAGPPVTAGSGHLDKL